MTQIKHLREIESEAAATFQVGLSQFRIRLAVAVLVEIRGPTCGRIQDLNRSSEPSTVETQVESTQATRTHRVVLAHQ